MTARDAFHFSTHIEKQHRETVYKNKLHMLHWTKDY